MSPGGPWRTGGWVRNEPLLLSAIEIWGCLLGQHNQVFPDGHNWEVGPQGFPVLLVSDFYLHIEKLQITFLKFLSWTELILFLSP